MDPKQKPQNSVHFGAKDQHLITDSDVESDGDPSLNINHSTILSKTSSAVRCSGDIHSVSSINTSILDDTEEIKALKEKLSDTEAKCKFFENENGRINADLTTERNRNLKLEKKLQFVKDNQEVFMRLKEAYINMKYNEAAGRKMIEIREKGMQTWQGILCKSCIESEEMRRQIEQIRDVYTDSFIISPSEMEQMMNTIKYLKDLVERREKSWTQYMERENKLYLHVTMLRQENLALKEFIKNKQINLDEVPLDEPISDSALPPSKEINQLKKIIVKLEKRIREMEESHSVQTKNSLPLNDKEKKIVQQLMAKYTSRVNTSKVNKSSEKLRSRSMSREPKKEKCPNNKSRTSADTKHDVVLSNMGFKCDKNADNAIMMMDHLFDSDHKLI